MLPQYSIINRILIFFLIVFSSGASSLSVNDTALIIFFAVTLVLFLLTAKSKKDLTGMLYVLFFIAAAACYYRFANGRMDSTTWLGFSIKILCAYMIVKMNRDEFTENMVHVIYFIAAASLIGFALQSIFPAQVFEYNNFFGMESRNNSNSLIFDFSYLHAGRNCGCMWEPGAFAVLLVMGLWLALLHEEELSKKYLVVLVIALLTTFSTSGYIAFGVILVYRFLLRNISVKKGIYAVLFIPLLVYSFINSELLGNKIVEQLSGINEELNKAYENPDYQVSVTRFASLAVDYPVFIQRPMLGYGVDVNTVNAKTLYKEYGENVVRSSGIFILLVQFGIIGLVFYFSRLYYSFKGIAGSSYAWFTVIVFFMLMFSTPMHFTPLIFSLFFIKNPGYDLHYHPGAQPAAVYS